MSEKGKPSLSHTPIPTDLLGLTKAVTRIEEGVVTIKSDLLPPVAEAASQARDGVIKLDGWSNEMTRRVKTLESTPPPAHSCDQESRLDSQDRAITAQERDLAGLSKWRTYVVTLVVPLLLAASGAASKAIWDSATVRAIATDNAEDNRDQEAHIEALEKSRQQDIERVVKEVRGVRQEVRQAEEELSVDEVKARMTASQRRRLERLLREAEINDR